MYRASYDIQLTEVTRPEKASSRFGKQKVETVGDDERYKYVFEDELVRVLWIATPEKIGFSLTNKTEHSIRIPWDEAAYVDEKGESHRVMHAGIKYTDRQNPMPPSVVVRGGRLEDVVYPADYASWSGHSWREAPLFPSQYFQSTLVADPKYPTLEAYDADMRKKYFGKTIQVLLPLQIEDVVNDYIFMFTVEGTASEQKY